MSAVRVTVLMENTAPEGLLCEHGLSLVIEHEGHSILLDAGSSAALLDNAARFTPPGGAVRLSAYVEEAVLTVAVEDSGPGFSPEALARAGKELFTGDTSRPQDGHMGLGLCFARQVAVRHGGELALSNTGTGARAALTLPLAEP